MPSAPVIVQSTSDKSKVYVHSAGMLCMALDFQNLGGSCIATQACEKAGIQDTE